MFGSWLTSEGVGLDVDISPGDAFQERRLSGVGEAADQQGAGVGVDSGETAKMLAHLVEIEEGLL